MKAKKLVLKEEVVREFLIPHEVEITNLKTFDEIAFQVKQITEQPDLLKMEEWKNNNLTVKDVEIEEPESERVREFYSRPVIVETERPGFVPMELSLD